MDKNHDGLDQPINWKYSSSAEIGLHEVITPENSACKSTWIYRLNLNKGMDYNLSFEDIELSIAIIKGSLTFTHNGEQYELEKMDSLYLPAQEELQIVAEKDAILFIGGGPYEGVGDFFVRRFDPERPLGDIRQIHGEPPYERDVYMAVNEEMPASRLITGFTWGQEGKWTSWPPHQHSKDLEEVYCYFDIPSPEFTLHLSSRKPGTIEAVHPVSSGDCVAIPEGYHPTVGMPGVKSCYFWVMVAHSAESRRYDLAVNDPNFE
jgi:5-deoxy-glucuronate isomerase